MAVGKHASVREAVLEYLATRKPAIVDRAEFGRLRSYVAANVRRDRQPDAEYLLDILLGTEIAVDRRIGGFPPDLRGRVDVSGLVAARRSLLSMAAEYEQARDASRAEDARRAVLRSKRHLKLALGNPMDEEKRPASEEVMRWLVVWLENPTIFKAWLALREGAEAEQGAKAS